MNEYLFALVLLSIFDAQNIAQLPFLHLDFLLSFNPLLLQMDNSISNRSFFFLNFLSLFFMFFQFMSNSNKILIDSRQIERLRILSFCYLHQQNYQNHTLYLNFSNEQNLPTFMFHNNICFSDLNLFQLLIFYFDLLLYNFVICISEYIYIRWQQMSDMNQSPSAISDTDDLQLKIENCLLKILKSSEHLLDSEIVQDIRSKIEEINGDDSVIESLEYFAFSLINKLQLISQRTTKLDINTEDYENLETSVQKAQAQIRKHIRLQQQLKLYMDGLEDRIQELENELRLETQKYHQLFESAKALDLQKRQLKKKLKAIQMKYKSHESTSKQIRIISHKVSKNLLSEPSMADNSNNPYYVPSTDKYKMIRRKKSGDKSSQASKQKQNNYTSYKKLLENDIRVSLNDSPKKKRSMQQSMQQPINQPTIDKTMHLKQSCKKNSRKLMKYSVEQPKIRKQIRSNSVCQ